MATFRAAGAEIERQYWLALLVEVYAKMGQHEQGRDALAEARAIVDKTGERWWEAELHRLEGELTLKQFGVRSAEFGVTNPQPPTPAPQVEAEGHFLKALAVARRQQAKSLELRAAMSLARLWQQQGKKAEARQLLAPVYHWFTEGFDTKDLQEAKALLDVLAA
jgi:predicted ATPase